MGGAERLLLQILSTINREIFSPRVCVLQNRGNNNLTDELYKKNIPIDLLSINKIFDLKAIPAITKYLRQNKADIVHTQLQLSDILGNISCFLTKTPSVCTIHTLQSQGSTVRNRVKQNLEWFVQRYCCQRVISVSEASRINYLEFNSNCKPSNVVTLHNGIDLKPFSSIPSPQSKEKIRQSLGISKQKRILTTVAVLRKDKGIQYALDALPDIIKHEPDLLYMIVGDGSYRESLEKQVEAKMLKKNILFTGQRDDIAQLLSISDIFLLPSLTEALPTVIAEAMAAQLPIIATSVGGTSEMISNNHNGLLIPPFEVKEITQACQSLLQDRQKAAILGDTGLKTVHQKFNIYLQVQELERLYLEIIQGEN